MSRRWIPIVALLLIVACGDDDQGGVFTTTTTAPSTTTTTTIAPTTTSSSTTTSVASTTTSSSTTTTSTTAAPAPEFEFRPDGLGIALFGDAPADVIAAMTDLFGAPANDTGWIDEVLCPGPLNRFVDFGVAQFDLRVLFTTGDLFAPAGTEHFYSYSYQGATPVPVFPPELTVGTTVAQLQALYPAVVFQDNPFLTDVTDYVVSTETEYAQLYGQVTGTGAGDVVTSVIGGIGCGE